MAQRNCDAPPRMVTSGEQPATFELDSKGYEVICSSVTGARRRYARPARGLSTASCLFGNLFCPFSCSETSDAN